MAISVESSPRSVMRTIMDAILTAIAAVLYGFGWVVGVICSVLVWCVAAVRVGWSEGMRR